MKTTLATKSDHTKNWYIVDAANETLGRVSVKIANVLRGRHKPTYTPHADTGDFVVVINAGKLHVLFGLDGRRKPRQHGKNAR